MSASLGVLILASFGGAFGQPEVVVDLAVNTDAIRWDARRVEDLFGEFATACDVNGDGVEDWIVAAYEGHGPDDSRSRAGDVYVVFGRRGRWTAPLSAASDADVIIYGQQAVDKLGNAISCGDLDGDGIADLLLGASFGDGPNNNRTSAGQVHILFGRSIWPDEIDLLTNPGTVVYGELAGTNLAGGDLAAGDIDGDGIDDLVVPAYKAPNRDGLFERVGRVYVLFGREVWLPVIDLMDERDLTIYGATEYDAFGGFVGTGDANDDGTADLMVGASGGDGPNDDHIDVGDVHVFWGRAVWPPEIDLRSEQADMLLFGPDNSDFSGDGVSVGDINDNGHADIIVGIARGDGRLNASPELGEARVYEPYPMFPANVDLDTESNTIIWGGDESDLFHCGVAGVKDVSGDRSDDLLCSAELADGPNNDDERMGEIHVFFGRPSLPTDLGVDVGDQDWTVYGRQAGDELAAHGQGDINGDGIYEIIAATLIGNDYLVSSSWLISPIDVDGDGWTQLPDNCPLVANPGQEDADGDDRGDACATDWDGDGIDDPDDCAIANADGGRPPAITGVSFAEGSHDELIWSEQPLAEEYDVSRGDLAAIGPGEYGACQNTRDLDRTDTSFLDDELPLPGEGYFFLFRGVDLDCPAVGTWGMTSSGLERENTNPAACP